MSDKENDFNQLYFLRRLLFFYKELVVNIEQQYIVLQQMQNLNLGI